MRRPAIACSDGVATIDRDASRPQRRERCNPFGIRTYRLEQQIDEAAAALAKARTKREPPQFDG